MKESKRLKIGIFMDDFYPSVNGVVLVIDNLAKMLSKNNDVTLVVPYTTSIDEDKNRVYEVKRIRSYRIPHSEFRFSEVKPRFSKVYKYLLSKKFDIVHIHSPFMVGKLGLRIAHDLNVPCVCTMHTRFDFEIRKRVNDKLIYNFVMNDIIKTFNRCDAGIAINSKMIDVYKDYGCTLNPKIIYNGTELLPLNDKEGHIKAVNKLYDLEGVQHVFLFVGRMVDIKNIFFILDALKLLKEDNVKFKMLYVGDGSDLEKLKKKTREYNMTDDVIFTGKIMNRELLSSIYLRSELFLFPSLFDASSLVQIEAAVNETPALFIEGSVTSDTVINNVSGFTAKNDVESYKNRIKEIINDKKLLKKVSVNARKMLGKSWADIAIETNDYYNYLIERKKLGE